MFKGTSPHTLSMIVIVAVLYYLIGNFGLYLKIPHTDVSPLWPAAGLALAAVILFNHYASIGVFLGATALNMTSLSNFETETSIATLALTSVFVGIGVAAQASFGRFLIQRYLPYYSPFENVWAVLKFLLLAMVSCLVSANIGILTFAVADIIPWASYPFLAWSWWIGDVAGIFTVTPIILLWFKARIHWHALPKGTIYGLFGVIAMITVLIFYLGLPLMFLFVPLMVFAARSLPPLFAALFNLLVVCIVSIFTANGYGQFVQEATLFQAILYLECFIFSLTATVLTLSADVDRLSK